MTNTNRNNGNILYILDRLEKNNECLKTADNTQHMEALNSERDLILKDLDKVVNNINKHIGMKIMQARNTNTPPVKQKELARMVGIRSSEHLRRIEQNMQTISAGRLAVIAAVQDKPISYYFNGFLHMSDKQLTKEQQVICSNLMDYFLRIEVLELQLIILGFIKNIANIQLPKTEKE